MQRRQLQADANALNYQRTLSRKVEHETFMMKYRQFQASKWDTLRKHKLEMIEYHKRVLEQRTIVK